MNNIFDHLLENNRDEMVESLQRLIRIRTITGESLPGMPFGQNIQSGLDFIMKLGEEKGFPCVNFDNYACELHLGDGEQSVGVVCHLDVVPEGSGWHFDPYGGELHNGMIYGRGAVDNKGPLIAAFYACLAIRDSGLPLKKKIKQIIGTNEETGTFPCIRYYLQHGTVPSCGIVPDSWFPVAFAEKGFYSYSFSKAITGAPLGHIVIDSLCGGEALNVVAPGAFAELTADEQGLAGIDARLSEFAQKDRIAVKVDGQLVRIETVGVAAHASTPEIGVNAIALLLDFLSGLDTVPADLDATIKKLALQVCRDTDGRGMGIDCCDETGSLTNNLGILHLEGGCLELKMNLRCPVTIPYDQMVERLKKAAQDSGMEYRLMDYNPHFYMPQDDPLIQLLSNTYQEVTGDVTSKPKAHGGGSYARILTNFVPFGPSIEGEELVFHKQDEYISCERLMLLARIYARALYRLANET